MAFTVSVNAIFYRNNWICGIFLWFCTTMYLSLYTIYAYKPWVL